MDQNTKYSGAGKRIKGVVVMLACAILLSGCLGSGIGSGKRMSFNFGPDKQLTLTDKDGTSVELRPIKDDDFAILSKGHDLVDVDSITIITMHSHAPCIWTLLGNKKFGTSGCFH